MDLPEEHGTYVLIARVSAMRRLEIGSLGKFDIIPGFYAYVGSAFGPGGLASRIGHHLESTADPHWHIDYLLKVAVPVDVWFTTAKRKLEHQWADLLENASNFRVPIPRFGSSDYHRSRTSHLFYSKRHPSFQWFRQQIRDGFDDIEVEQHIILARIEKKMNSQPQKLLFICSENRMRSLTAERMYAGFPDYEVKSAGTEDSARIPLTREHVQWADLIFAMEPEHLEKMQDRFGDEPAAKRVICLDIPDIYNFMEPALIEELRAKLSEHIKVPG